MSEDRIDQLLAECLGAPDTEWNSRLASHCAAHAELAPELRRRYRRLIELGMIEAPPDGFEQFGRYRLLRKLGRGAMGVVFLAQEPEQDRQVALKLVRPELLGSDRARERFRREADAAARLDHPGICAVLDAGEVEGKPYLAMRYLLGETLEQRLRLSRAGNRGVFMASDPSTVTGSAPLRPADLRPALQLVEQLALAIEAAHAAGLVHRDLKPANVMVTADGPVLMDFGLVHDTDGERLTQSEQVLGTPAYMAPEQVRGGAVDRRADVWALGALLYECLTLRPPFTGQSREDLYRAILSDDPIDVRRLQPAASRELATVVHTALHKEPARRYQTALLLAADLRAVLEGRPTRARPPGPLARTWQLARRHRTLTAVALALLLGLVSSLLLLVRSQDAERRSRAVAEVLRAHAARGDPLRRFAILDAAFALAPMPEVMAALNAQLPELQEHQVLRQLPGRAESLLRSPTGRWFLVSGNAMPAVLFRRDGSFWCQLPWPIAPQRPAVAFSPDEGQLLVLAVIGPNEDRLMLCRLDGEVLQTEAFGPPLVPGAERWGRPREIAWSGQGRIAVSYVRDDGPAKVVCYAESGIAVFEVPQPARCRGAAFRADGALLVPAGIVPEKELSFRFELGDTDRDPVSEVLAVGDLVIVGSSSGLRVFDGAGTQLLDRRRTASRAGTMLNTVEAAPDGTLLAAFQDGVVQVLAPDGRVETWCEEGSTWASRFSPDGTSILTAGWRGLVTIRDRRGQLLHRWQGHQNGAMAAWMADGSGRVITASWDGTVRSWTPGEFLFGPMHSGFPRAVLGRAGALLIVASEHGRLLAFDREAALVAEHPISEGFPILHPHRDGRSIWVGEFDADVLQAWDPIANQMGPKLQLGGPGRGPVGVAHMASGELLTSDGWYGVLRRHQASGKSVRLPGTNASHVAAWNDGTQAVSIGGRFPFRILDQQGNVTAELPEPETTGHPSMVTSLVVSRDGGFAMVGRTDGSVSRWDLHPLRHRARWMLHHDRVRDLAIADDGSLLASVTSGGHLVICRSTDGKTLMECHLDGETLESVTFFADAVVTTGWRDSGRLRWWWWEQEALERRLVPVRKRLRESSAGTVEQGR